MRFKVGNREDDFGMTEHEEQKALIKWWSTACNGFGIPEVCLFAIPNAARRSMKIASMLKAEGMRSGIPDLILAVPRGEKHGLFIEMKKTKGGRVSDNQKIMLSAFSEQGYETQVCKGFEAAKSVIENYLKGEKTC